MPKRCCARPTASWRARTAPGSSTPPLITTEMRRTSFRPERVGELIRQTIAAFLTGDVRDPRIGFVTVTGVQVSADLSHATVRVSVMGSDEEKARSLEGLASYAAGWNTAYDGVIRLGTRTATDDPTGAVVETSDAWRDLDRDAVAAALGRFRGPQRQRPPAHSAVKVGGERAYRRARRGEPVELPERDVEFRELELVAFAPPDARFRAVVSGGTYLRSLARDVG